MRNVKKFCLKAVLPVRNVQVFKLVNHCIYHLITRFSTPSPRTLCSVMSWNSTLHPLSPVGVYPACWRRGSSIQQLPTFVTDLLVLSLSISLNFLITRRSHKRKKQTILVSNIYITTLQRTKYHLLKPNRTYKKTFSGLG